MSHTHFESLQEDNVNFFLIFRVADALGAIHGVIAIIMNELVKSDSGVLGF